MSKLQNNKLCILLHQIGPYHHARLNALARCLDVLVVEIRATSTEYYWTNLDHGVCNYSVVRAQGKVAIVNVFKQHSIDFFLTYGWNEPEYLQTILYAKKNRKQVFMASDSIEIGSTRNVIKHFIKRKIAQSIDGFLVAGKRSEAYIRYYVPQAIIEKPFDVVDNEHFLNAQIYEPEGYLLCMARLIKEKNIPEFILALSQIQDIIRKKNTSVIIVGAGEEYEIINLLIENNNVSDFVKIISWKSYNEIPALYHQASALILPSISDTWGLVVNEAMAAGLPILLSKNCGCTLDLLLEGENGLSFSPSCGDIARAIKQYLEISSEQKRAMGARSKAIIAYYDLNAHATAIQNLQAVALGKSLSSSKKCFLQVISALKR